MSENKKNVNLEKKRLRLLGSLLREHQQAKLYEQENQGTLFLEALGNKDKNLKDIFARNPEIMDYALNFAFLSEHRYAVAFRKLKKLEEMGDYFVAIHGIFDLSLSQSSPIKDPTLRQEEEACRAKRNRPVLSPLRFAAELDRQRNGNGKL